MKKMALRLVALVTPLTFAATAFAQEGDGNNDPTAIVGRALAAGFAIGIAAFGCGLGQGRAAAAALDGIARNPNASGKILVPLILGLALIESLAIYALVIAFQIQPK
jgi:F-type H+-transporting ATPase subunit c